MEGAKWVCVSDKMRDELEQRSELILEEAGDFSLNETPATVLKAVRRILRTEKGESILYRAVTVIRRYDDMALQLGNTFK